MAASGQADQNIALDHTFTVIEADNGNGAVDVFRASRGAIDIVVLDMTLPGIPGREVLGKWRWIQPR
jgi:DNA-binding response OmpR family regulator